MTAVPGASAVLTALALSGLPTDRFVFEGFPPRKPGERRRFLQTLLAEPRTTVLFESPNRTASLLAAMVEVFGPDRQVVVARELTKLYEEVVRGTVAEVATWAEGGVRGEVVVVLAGVAAGRGRTRRSPCSEVLALVEGGTKLKDATTQVASRTGLSRKALYDAALAAKRTR